MMTLQKKRLIMSDEDFVGKIPAVQELTVLPADNTNQLKLNWTVREYMGCDVYIEGDQDKKPITTKSGIKVGDRLVAWGYIIVVTELDPPSAETTSGSTLVILEFDKDDRHCWVAGGMINKRALKQLCKTTIIG
jgi:hypothetical protein